MAATATTAATAGRSRENTSDISREARGRVRYEDRESDQRLCTEESVIHTRSPGVDDVRLCSLSLEGAVVQYERLMGHISDYDTARKPYFVVRFKRSAAS